jgi:hypothetical protein
LIQTLQERLLTLEMDKQRLLTLYTDSDRRVQDKMLEIDAQKKRLVEAQSQQWVPDNEVTQVNDRRRDLEEKILAARLSVQKNKFRYEGAKAITIRDAGAGSGSGPGGRREAGAPSRDAGVLRSLSDVPQEGGRSPHHRGHGRQQDHQRRHR